MPLYRNRMAAVFAVFAMALQGLWPFLAQAQPGGLKTYGPVCTVGGVNAIDLSGKLPADGGAGKHQKHCALCVAGGDRVQALVLVQALPFAAPTLAAEAPAARSAAFYCSTADSLAQPRAPPSLS